MFDLGLLNEFAQVKQQYKLTQNNQSMQAIGYKELFLLEDRQLTELQTRELIKKNSRNYAKRQITFMKGFKDEAKWFDPLSQKEEIYTYIEEELKKYDTNR